MKIRYLLLFVILSTLCAAQTNDGSRYASSSVLATGQWTKISVDKSGIYRLDYGDIKAMGIVPENVRIYGYGGALLSEDFTAKYIDDLPQVPIYIHMGYLLALNIGILVICLLMLLIPSYIVSKISPIRAIKFE